MRIAIRAVSGVALAVASFVGCGSGDETESIKLVPVTGVVSLNGKPVEGASVTFTPNAGSKPNTPGSDMSGPEGTYKLMYRGRSGVTPGKYKVTVSKTFEPADAKVPEEFKDDPVLAAMEKQKALQRQQIKQGKKAVSTSVEESFEREVSERGEVFDFDLKGGKSKG